MRWELRSEDAAQVRSLAAALADLPALKAGRISPSDAGRLTATLAGLLVRRGISDPEAAADYLSPSLSHLHSPDQMMGLSVAVDRLDAAIAHKEPILIYGDYDVDGTMAVIILKTAIELCGGAADFHVPHRIREGYDMRDDVIERAAAAGIRLIISVDMGIRAFAPAETAQRLGVDLIVTDHHLPGPDGVPKAWAVVNPNQAGCEYPYKQLCGAGVAFKLAQGLMQRRLDAKDHNKLLLSFLKLVAIATIADAVPLTGENRVFASLGLDALRRAVNPGLKALLEVAQISASRPPTSVEVAFRVAPRINAAGRMDVARDVIELFSVKDALRARELAAKLDQLNTDRQEEERRILKAVEERFTGDPALCDAYCIVVDGDGWHRGVIGITATRVVERYNRPTVVIAREGEEAFGSGRSIPAFHLLGAIESCHDLFSRYGGHAHACGFAMPAANVEELRVRLDAFARTRLTPADFDPVLDLDAELWLGEITPELFQALRLLEPYGVGNPEPVFAARGVQLKAPPRILKDKHVKLKLKPGPGAVFEPGPAGVGDPSAQPAGRDHREMSATAILTTPRCHPDGAAIRRAEKAAAVVERDANSRRTDNRELRSKVTFDALGWHMAERLVQTPLLAGDTVDIAFTVGHNDHPEYGGLELSLRDFKIPVG
ncbi:Exonuclease RecJ (modular protein) [Candidatus Sulfotelmatobacter kueseliae]|uniref:Single-stranded-DNA-specific exonuclease RecJ n=1 Tax=Candidatus Sulfotelmatobacter kueseliae TaxID=2042962 RepID=A0A2U3KCJ7_9BACT|nr:Exonuclease RecJ (modular protein) [Candidatus Sulfotelmatobacter kueseliae]